METEQRIAKAKEVVSEQFGLHGKPDKGIDESTAFYNVIKMRALEKLCGHCNHIELELRRRNGRERVALGCSKGHSPVALYENILFGEEAFCPGYSKRVLK